LFVCALASTTGTFHLPRISFLPVPCHFTAAL
jgi:hypothetical protein